MWSDGDSFSTWKKERVWNGMRVKKIMEERKLLPLLLKNLPLHI